VSFLRDLALWQRIGLALLVLPFLLWLGMPENVVDCYLYHLGAIDQWMQAHRVLTDNVPLSHHFPLPFDMGFYYPLLLGDDRAAKGLVFLSFFAGTTAFIGLRKKKMSAVVVWLAIVVSLSAGTMLHFATVAKNDVVGAACCVVGAASLLDRRFLMGALFSGMGVAAKPVFAPLVLMALVISKCPWRLVVPAVPGVPELPVRGDDPDEVAVEVPLRRRHPARGRSETPIKYNGRVRKNGHRSAMKRGNGGSKENGDRLMRAVTTSTAVEVGVARAREIERAISNPSAGARALRERLLQPVTSSRSESR
jgi:hypothetical protein